MAREAAGESRSPHPGARLLARAEGEARGRGAAALWLSVWARNQRALRFYVRLGWRDVGATAFMLDGVRHANRVLTRGL